jgi:hypothetical protein
MAWDRRRRSVLKERLGMENYQFDPHSFQTVKRISYQVCVKCGLVLLKNKATFKAVKLGCDYRVHPSIIQEKSNEKERKETSIN